MVRFFCASVICLLGIGISTLPGPLFSSYKAQENAGAKTLTFAERVSYQRAIEDIYWRHRIWPKERRDPKPSLDAVMSQAQLERKVADYLHNSRALEDYWQRPITAEQLQVEMDRMAKNTKQPEVLRELFEALGNDPFVIAECLARPTLADRLRTDLAAHPQGLLDSWRPRTENQMPKLIAATTHSYTLPEISTAPNGCIDDTWAATTGPPDLRSSHTAVWTGSEMIVWGGLSGANWLLNSGGRYNPATDTWAPTSTTNAPVARFWHTAVWTGSEMIVWGGFDGLVDYYNTGGRYSPSTDTWTAMSTTNAPIARFAHTAVWTGSEMIVWGGQQHGVALNTGGRYNPVADSWTATSTTNAPEARFLHTAVWTGSEMIVWGGTVGPILNTGGRYNPSTDSWTATSTTNAPDGRQFHRAVWTDTEMIVWGGCSDFACSDDLNTGGRYNPGTDSWTPTSTGAAPAARDTHTAVWTGSEMIVWGGLSGNTTLLNTGGRYNPSTDSWTATSLANAPDIRNLHTAVWTGSEMIVWGGNLNTGGRYDPTTDSWTNTGSNNAPSVRSGDTAVWTGSEMIIWGGDNTYAGQFNLFNTGARYAAATDSWTTTSTTNAPEARASHTAVWTGSEMIVWGGASATGELNTGGKYNPTEDSWIATSTTNAPVARLQHTAVWTGTEMIAWGGHGCGGNCNLNSGGRYNPNTNSWTPTTITNAPSARWDQTAVWTGSEMIVWGGTDAIPNHTYLHTGGRYNPATDTWMPTGLVKVPLGRIDHTAVWTGSEMIVWGGIDETFNDSNSGGRYNPTEDSWAATGIAAVPTPRYSHTAVWIDSEMIVWGGYASGIAVHSGGRYNPETDSWTATSITNAPIGRYDHTAVWTGNEMIVWGGDDSPGFLNSGGRYCAQSAPTPTITPTPTVTPTATPTVSPTPRIRPTPRRRPTPQPRP